LPPFVGSAGQLVWEGVLACADCEGIETRLVLDREGIDPIFGSGHAQPRYELLETFLADDGGERYREQGQWQREGRLLRLQAEAGGERVFAIEPDGRLSLRDGNGGEPGGAARLLAPVTAPHP
jgi:copper homeostasis protein (lipoprotein)